MTAREVLAKILTMQPRLSLYSRLKGREYRSRFPGSDIDGLSIIPKGKVKIGRGTYGRPHIRLYHPEDEVIIGSYCSIGPEVLILGGGEHPLDSPSSYPIALRLGQGSRAMRQCSKGPVRIGHDVWIGARCTIISGASIGDGAVIGAGSVVTKTIPAFAVASGVPAQVRRFRLTPTQIEDIERIAWWNWPEERILASLDLFDQSVDAFIAQCLGAPSGPPDGAFR